MYRAIDIGVVPGTRSIENSTLCYLKIVLQRLSTLKEEQNTLYTQDHIIVFKGQHKHINREPYCEITRHTL